jgi:hypothetical protein
MDQIASTEVERYLRTIGAYDNEFAKWNARVKKIIKRYRDDTRSSQGNETAKFNILWSNVQTLIPAVYAKLPKADVSRRFGDNDPVSRVASLLIERAVDFEIEHYPDFRATMKECVTDRFLGGRGTAWVRYEPHVKPQGIEDDGLEITEDIEAGEGEPNRPEEIEYECAPVDYVHWRDFGCSVARTWEEVTQVWRWVYMTREALVERFGEEAARKIPLDQGPEPLNAYNEQKKNYNRAKICELWDKERNKVVWLCKGLPEVIDERDDPLGLEGFWPCPRPLFATTTSDSLVPVPDFVLYQDQAMELDILSDRIDGLVKALRVRGVYDASQPALQRLMTEGDNNALIPVDKWTGFSEKGGLKGSVDLLPLDTIAQALIQCYQARSDIKAQIYEITGISDIIRGQGAASETATAQQIKGQYAGLRLRSMQEDVALFASDLIRLKAQIICTKFQPETILQYAAANQMSPSDQQLIPQAMRLIKDRPLRNFRIEIASDSLVQIDEAQNKRDRLEFIQAYGGFLSQALPVAQASPQMVPMMMELLKYGIGAFKQARGIEGELDTALEQMKQQAQQPKPNPEAEAEQAKMQAEQQKVQAEMQMEQAKLQQEGQLRAQEMQMQAQIDKYKADLDAQTKINVARIAANPGIDIPMLEVTKANTERMMQNVEGNVVGSAQAIQELQQQTTQLYAEMMGKLEAALKAMTAPKRIVRGPDGRAAGVEIVQQPVQQPLPLAQPPMAPMPPQTVQ